MSELRKSFKKDWNYIRKRLVNVNKGGTFAPATAKNVHRNTDRQYELKEKKFSKKRFEKACGIWKCFLHLHPAKHGKFIERLAGKDEKQRRKKSFKFF